MKPKHLPRLWCALHGLLPLETRPAAPSGELTGPFEAPQMADRPIGPARVPVISNICRIDLKKCSWTQRPLRQTARTQREGKTILD